MHLYKTTQENLVTREGKYFAIEENWDTLLNRNDLAEYLLSAGNGITEKNFTELLNTSLLPPIGSQEVWAAGVTYLRSRDARVEESKNSGGADCYQKVYEAERPELFFKALPHRVAGHNQNVNIRKDSTWNVPEPELTLFINSSGKIQGYTAGNDMSSRSIEGENPLYLPQAKIYEKSAGLGPCIYITDEPISPDTDIRMRIYRKGEQMFDENTSPKRMKRNLNELVEYLFRECSFPNGCFLMTGTCIVPPDNFTLQKSDVVEITISGIGTLVNIIDVKP